MSRFLLRRAVLAVLVCATVLVISFALTRVAGDPALAVAGPQATAEDIAAIRTAYGLDRPLPRQFLDWVAAAAHGDLGRSYLFREPVLDLVLARLPVTLTLGLVGLGFALLIAVPLGVVAAGGGVRSTPADPAGTRRTQPRCPWHRPPPCTSASPLAVEASCSAVACNL